MELKTTKTFEEQVKLKCNGDQTMRSKCSDDAFFTGINSLPTEILLRIFSFLEVADLSLSVRSVCSRWEKLVNEPLLWHNLEFRYCYQYDSLNVAIETLSRSPLLESLCISGHRGGNRLLRIASEKCKNIRTLKIDSIRPIATNVLKTILRHCSNLSVLDMGIDICFDIDSVVRHFGNLKVLKLPHYEDLNGSQLRKIADQCRHLEVLDITDTNNIFDDDIIYLIRKRKLTIRSLVIDGSLLTDVAFSKLGTVQNLTNLQIFHCENMTDKGLCGFSNLNLSKLVLNGGVHLTSEAMVGFFANKNQPHLKYLDLAQCINVCDSVLEIIATNCPLLVSINILGCEKVSSQGVCLLKRTCKNLKFVLEDWEIIQELHNQKCV